jgi:hypothetical protein
VTILGTPNLWGNKDFRTLAGAWLTVGPWRDACSTFLRKKESRCSV